MKPIAVCDRRRTSSRAPSPRRGPMRRPSAAQRRLRSSARSARSSSRTGQDHLRPLRPGRALLPAAETISPVLVATADLPQCFVGYRCVDGLRDGTLARAPWVAAAEARNAASDRLRLPHGRTDRGDCHSPESCDVVIVGAGHNGLTCAAYLGRAGLRVKVFERRDIVGGAAVTEEFHPGFRNSVASLHRQPAEPEGDRGPATSPGTASRIVERRASNFLPTPDGDYLAHRAGAHAGRDRRGSAARDAERYDAFGARDRRRRGRAARPRARASRPTSSRAGAARARRTRAGPRLSAATSGGSQPERRALLDLFTKSAADYLDGWFESRARQGRCSASTRSSATTPAPTPPAPPTCCSTTPSARSTASKGAWGHAIGGMGAITQAMAAACRGRRGVEIETERAGRARCSSKAAAPPAIVLEGRPGDPRAPRVAANVNPKLLYTRLVAADGAARGLLAPDASAGAAARAPSA